MGADLLLTYAPVPRWRWKEPGKVAGLSYVQSREVVNIWDWSQGEPPRLTEDGALVRAGVQARIAELPDQRLADAWDEATGCDIADEENPREYLLRCFDDVTVGGRDIAVMQIEGKRYYFTGGMSWGDDPTDSYQKVSLLSSTGLLDEPFGFDPMHPDRSQGVNG